MSVEISRSFFHRSCIDLKPDHFPQGDVHHGGSKEQAQEMPGKDGTQPPALTLFLWHRFPKHLVLKDKMATIYNVLNLFLLKKEVTYCLVSSHVLCLVGCVWRSQESLAEEGRAVWLH